MLRLRHFWWVALVTAVLSGSISHAADEPCIDHIPSVKICDPIVAARVPLENEQVDDKGRPIYSLILFRDFGNVIIGVNWADTYNAPFANVAGVPDSDLAFDPAEEVALSAMSFGEVRMEDRRFDLRSSTEYGPVEEGSHHAWAGVQIYDNTTDELGGRDIYHLSIQLADADKSIDLLFTMDPARMTPDALMSAVTFHGTPLSDLLQ